MTEYVDRGAFIEVLETAIKMQQLAAIMMDAEDDPEIKMSIKAYNDILNGIKEFPAADVAERKKGKWVKARGSWFTPGGDPVWECSECGKGTHVYGTEHGTYGHDVADGQWVSCPNCGAKMET